MASTTASSGAISDPPASWASAQRPSGPESTSAATSTEASTTRPPVTSSPVGVTVLEDHRRRDALWRQLIVPPDPGEPLVERGPSREPLQRLPQVLLHRLARPCGPRGQLVPDLVRHVADGDLRRLSQKIVAAERPVDDLLRWMDEHPEVVDTSL